MTIYAPQQRQTAAVARQTTRNLRENSAPWLILNVTYATEHQPSLANLREYFRALAGFGVTPRLFAPPQQTFEFCYFNFSHRQFIGDIDHRRASHYVSAMAKLDIITLPDPLLRQASAPVERVDREMRQLMDDMLETMYIAPGIGLAAIQVAVPRRLLVVDVGDDDDFDDEDGFEGDDFDDAGDFDGTGPQSLLRTSQDGGKKPPRDIARNPICMVNPKILSRGDATRSYEEGCLSLPDVLVEIERPTSLRVQYIDRDGTEQILDAQGLLATVIQHEMDHLDGKLIIDFMSRLKRDMVIRKFKKMKR